KAPLALGGQVDQPDLLVAEVALELLVGRGGLMKRGVEVAGCERPAAALPALVKRPGQRSPRQPRACDRAEAGRDRRAVAPDQRRAGILDVGQLASAARIGRAGAEVADAQRVALVDLLARAGAPVGSLPAERHAHE